MAETKRPALTACSYDLFHAPHIAVDYGTTPEAERESNPGSAFLADLEGSLRDFDDVVAYPPDQAFIGNLDPRHLPPRPWHQAVRVDGDPGPEGVFGAILDEIFLLGLIRFSDVFDLVLLRKDISDRALGALEADRGMRGADFSRFGTGVDSGALGDAVAAGALPLRIREGRVGCVKAAHPTDGALSARTMLENLCSKATAVYALRRLLAVSDIDPASVDYVIETSEEACGDMNQRGGGNFAKAIGELCGLSRATGSDVRSFCAGPVHGLVQAASHVAAGTFGRVVVVAGGATAKLAMNARKHLAKGLPLLEDCLGSFAFLVEPYAGRGLALRNDLVGLHRIGSGSSPQAVIQDLVVDPLGKGGFALGDMDRFAPELQNPEITEAAGAGNVTLSNMKMIAAMAVMRREIAREGIDEFIRRHGLVGWAPTQGHIPSGVPALGWFLAWAGRGELSRALVIGKGSLFLGRMTNLFDGVSIVVEVPDAEPGARATGPKPCPDPQPDRAASGGPPDAPPAGAIGPAAGIPEATAAEATAAEATAAEATATATVAMDSAAAGLPGSASRSPAGRRVLRLGLTIPGSESPDTALLEAAADARARDPDLIVLTFGERHQDAGLARREMEAALADGTIDGAITFHHPFPLGTATIGRVRAPATGRDLYIAATTGTMCADRVEALVRSAIGGIAVARACGVLRPRVGLLNLDGAAIALGILRELEAKGYDPGLTRSGRGDPLLRGNDILAGTTDVLVCDSLTGNALMKVLAAYPSGGTVEVLGSGYGPCVGSAEIPVGIVSRASSAAVVTEALLYLARALRGDLYGVHRRELRAAEAAGLDAALALLTARRERRERAPSVGSGSAPGDCVVPEGTRDSGIAGMNPPGAGNHASRAADGSGPGPARRPVGAAIEGVDVLEIEAAAGALGAAGIYCETAMGCTGPVVMVPGEDMERAKSLLVKSGFIQGGL